MKLLRFCFQHNLKDVSYKGYRFFYCVHVFHVMFPANDKFHRRIQKPFFTPLSHPHQPLSRNFVAIQSITSLGHPLQPSSWNIFAIQSTVKISFFQTGSALACSTWVFCLHEACSNWSQYRTRNGFQYSTKTIQVRCSREFEQTFCWTLG